MDLCMALLDWEKAFDKVVHDKLLEALERLVAQLRDGVLVE